MSITDELREFIDGADGYELWCPRHKTELTAIADRIDKGMGELGWVRLPVDADGKAIRVGDTLDGYNETTVVKELTLGDDGWSMTCENGLWFNFAAFTHHHEPTVEDVLFEFARFWCDEELTDIEHLQPDAAQTIAEYAEKLQLRED